jgi:hypothetical protein
MSGFAKVPYYSRLVVVPIIHGLFDSKGKKGHLRERERESTTMSSVLTFTEFIAMSTLITLFV